MYVRIFQIAINGRQYATAQVEVCDRGRQLDKRGKAILSLQRAETEKRKETKRGGAVATRVRCAALSVHRCFSIEMRVVVCAEGQSSYVSLLLIEEANAKSLCC